MGLTVMSAKQIAHVEIFTRRELYDCPHWSYAFGTERKDRRYYEIIEDTTHPEFKYGYFAIKDTGGNVYAIQPFFILDQDLLLGARSRLGTLVGRLRRMFPRFMQVRTLMVGCVAGEGHLDAADEISCCALARALATDVIKYARTLGASLVVLKEFPARYRTPMVEFLVRGFACIPSLPMTRVSIDYANFEDYMVRALNSATRRKLRRKFRNAEGRAKIEMTVVTDIASIIDEIYPLYVSVYDRSKLHFEKLTKEYFRAIGNLMPDKVRFFVWRQNAKIIGFAECMVQRKAFYAEYIGLDYAVALDLHLYHWMYRDMVTWAIANGYKEFRSSGLNYDPKLHLRHLLDPIDLYVRHTSTIANRALKLVLPLLEPTKYDATLRKFANYRELWG